MKQRMFLMGMSGFIFLSNSCYSMKTSIGETISAFDARIGEGVVIPKLAGIAYFKTIRQWCEWDPGILLHLYTLAHREENGGYNCPPEIIQLLRDNEFLKKESNNLRKRIRCLVLAAIVKKNEVYILKNPFVQEEVLNEELL